MKSLHKKGIKERCKELFARIGGVKNIEIIIAAILAVIAIIVYIGISSLVMVFRRSAISSGVIFILARNASLSSVLSSR